MEFVPNSERQYFANITKINLVIAIDFKNFVPTTL